MIVWRMSKIIVGKDGTMPVGKWVRPVWQRGKMTVWRVGKIWVVRGLPSLVTHEGVILPIVQE